MDAASPALRQTAQCRAEAGVGRAWVAGGGSMTIRADVSAPDGARFIREALVSLAEGGRPYLCARMAARRHRSNSP